MFLEKIINFAIASDVVFEVIKDPNSSARKVSWKPQFFKRFIQLDIHFQYVEKNNRQIIRDPEELRKICKNVIEKYDVIVRKARRKKPGEYEKVLKAVMKESERRADLELTKPLLNELLGLS